MAENQRKTQLESLKHALSVKTFITDIPRIINNALALLVNTIFSFYTPTDATHGDISNINRIDCTYLNATTVKARNLVISTDNGNMDYSDIVRRLQLLEEKVERIQAIPKETIQSIYEG